jgi:hypothetical protein
MKTPRFALPAWILPVAAASLLGLLPAAASASVSINLAAGYLRENASIALPATTNGTNNGGGSLLVLIAAGGNGGTTFTNQLSPGEYVAGGDKILANFGFNNYGGSSANGIGQTTTNSIEFTIPDGVSPGTPVELRWFTLTLSQYNVVYPAAGSIYGNYNPIVYHPTGSSNPDGGNAWVVPADGSSAYQLNFFTTDNTQVTGSQAPAEGYASFTVAPEPAAYVWLGIGGVAFLGYVRTRRRIGWIANN